MTKRGEGGRDGERDKRERWRQFLWCCMIEEENVAIDCTLQLWHIVTVWLSMAEYRDKSERPKWRFANDINGGGDAAKRVLRALRLLLHASMRSSAYARQQEMHPHEGTQSRPVYD
jgi:hypothetical protein